MEVLGAFGPKLCQSLIMKKKNNELIFEIMTQLQVQFKENDHILFHLFDTPGQIILRRK